MVGFLMDYIYKGELITDTYWKINQVIFNDTGNKGIGDIGPFAEFDIDFYLSQESYNADSKNNKINGGRKFRITDVPTLFSFKTQDVPTIRTTVYNLLKSYIFPGEETAFFATATDAP